ncbi:MAG: transcriptional regulator [Bdellovibrionales bacterium RIFOXYD12_FULL_39_22]|nr:MAG: transcriptional regulator [Bdellovibrionales bacterium RIFOXYB1_FULL_39_21]OFZ43133.1 MAG: transcriptional regulator [Bdellovibrionales bacterium RIFOXYC12_FULL_39_17]OFZ47871.1 MAG: transcriptional regulator [Bdellovibrionales bacterium RIFOXYC1_FULL_39_130]OFZ75651.1 MAG: transcriptional regulator [Bdellovibrionales bacterium RIFOXYD1_FULL_39_84]OFZ94141.1 MAG: transcriptional regulator [Bdellovibrionales bacterium RIFOXYD12_FULL_39_22]HLE11794.1 YebC/PmpR family DNA-binding transcri
MAGHSQFKNIQHRKNAQDAKKGKVFTKLIKEIAVAVREGGGPDIDSNPRLRTALQNARGANMPKDVFERAVKKAAGDGEAAMETINFEAYGPEGSAIMVEAATDNNTRTVANIRSYFNKHGGNLGKEGCLQFIFTRKGVFTLEKILKISEDDFMLEIIDSGAEDVEIGEEFINIICEKDRFGDVSKKLSEMKLEPKESGLQWMPNDTKKISEKAQAAVAKLIDVLEEDDDVLKVYHNVEL